MAGETGTLTKAVDNVEGNEAASEKPIRHSHFLCAGEQEYVDRRKIVVLESLNSLGINCTADSIPHIALLASGGGQRAAVGLVGSLYQMEKEGLLDTLLYLGGVSGSTWSMSSLYSDPQWSTNTDRAVSRLSGPGVELEQALAWAARRPAMTALRRQARFHWCWQHVHWNLNVWRNFMFSDESRFCLQQLDCRVKVWRRRGERYADCCTDRVTSFGGGSVMVAASPSLEKQGLSSLEAISMQRDIEMRFCNQWQSHISTVWDRTLSSKMTTLAPTEWGLSETTSRIWEWRGWNGLPTVLTRILGCALAHEEVIRDFIPPWLNVPGQVDSAAEEYLRIYRTIDKLVDLTRSTINDPTALSDLNKLQKTLKDKVNLNESALLESKSLEERKSIFQQWSLELLAAVETWSQSLEDGAFKTHVSLLTKQVLPLILKWEWGTTKNFLYQYQGLTIPPCLQSKERLHLVDAGLLINVAYPPFLGDKRDIDLMIAPEYSAGNMFETLTLARDYATEVRKPFPEIDNKILEERDWPKDCYVFEGKEKEPTIIYMPLFNRQNCKDAEEFKARMEEFSTFQRPFSQEKIEFVLETVKANMKNNKDTLVREINKATLRRQNKRKSLQH
ncbi:cytosolic phospholipase A2 gamma-like isoform X1 [Lates japonicus]|uniref:Cytosolic phospholipase A2 gamma-like isoform X1 n=1 Tax=Lates japonicus TaxID=270547 RepID=A0AAD3MWP8_LATJO|nr:cytosolic phospholipase A2 gamma-like isoform X1 [Lates japonicus]